MKFENKIATKIHSVLCTTVETLASNLNTDDQIYRTGRRRGLHFHKFVNNRHRLRTYNRVISLVVGKLV